MASCASASTDSTLASDISTPASGTELSSEDELSKEESSEEELSEEESSEEESSEEESSVEESSEVFEASVNYISERYFWYYEEEGVYGVVFSLLDQNNNYMEASGTAKVVITDANKNELYNKDIAFTEKDFTDWTNNERDESTHGCWLKIPVSELKKSTSVKGEVSITVTGDSFSFDEYKLTATNLPEKRVELLLNQQLPLQLIEQDYDDSVKYMTIHEVNYKSSLSYDGTAALSIDVLVSLDSMTGNTGNSDRCEFKYKVTDNNGLVVKSDTCMSEEIAVGEKTKANIILFDLDPNKSYTIQFDNYLR